MQINSSVESLGLDPLKTKVEAYLQLSSELITAFGSSAFDESLWLASTSFGANSTLRSTGHDIDTELFGYDSPTLFPSAAPTMLTPAPTPTLYFDPTNSTLSDDESDQTAVIAGSTAAAVVGSGAVGAVAYNYATSGLSKVAAEAASDVPEISV